MRPATLLLSALASIASPSPAQDHPDPVEAIPALVEDGLKEEQRLYFLKCQNAYAHQERHRRDALIGLAFFLADVPLEYASSRITHLEKRHPPSLNAAAFLMMGLSLFHLARSNRHYAAYEADRNACRCWQEYAGNE
jgi:hypothetical protein